MSKSSDLSKSKSSDLSKSDDLTTSTDLLISKKKRLENFPKKCGVITNVYGKHGCGKTTFFESRRKNFVFMDHDVLRSKENTSDFMEMMRYSLMPLVLDDYELVESLPGIKELKPLRVPFYIVSCNPIDSSVIQTERYEFPGVDVEEFARKYGVSASLVEELSKKSNGNMSSVKIDLENFKSTRDVFMTSKEYVHELLFSHDVPLTEFIDKHLTEHGNTLGMIQENYPDFCEFDEDDDDGFAEVSHSLSDADLIDTKIYSDVSWNLMQYFNVSACLIPAAYMRDGSSKTTIIRPGSVWTKHSNMLMRRNRFKRLRMNRDDIQLWALKLENEESHKFDSYDLDSINQLSFTKIKPRILNSLKKKCRKE